MYITFRWSEDLAELGPEDWARCFGTDNILTSYAMQRALERSELAERIYYLRLYRDNCLIGIVCCHVFRYSLTDLATTGIQLGMNWLRKFYPNLLRQRLFVVGSPIATCTHLLGFTLPPEDPDFPLLVQTMERAVDIKATDLGIGLICIKEVDESLHRYLHDALSDDFNARRSPDTTYIYTAPILGLEYSENMLSRYRKVWRRRKRSFENSGLRWMIIEDFSHHVDRLHSLYSNVREKSQTRFECLTPAFFHAVNEELGKQSQALLCLDGAHIVAFELLLVGQQLHPLYLGIDYDYRDASALYFNCLYRVIEEAQIQGMDYIELGQTSYEAKFSVGAVACNRYFYIKHKNPIYNQLLRKFQEKIFPTPQIPAPRHVFKHDREYMNALRSAGVLHAAH